MPNIDPAINAAVKGAAFVYKIVTEDVWTACQIPTALADAGFAPCGRIGFGGAGNMATVVMAHPTQPFQVTYDEDTDGEIGTCCALVPNTPATREALIDIAKDKPRVKETTRDVTPMLAYLPDMLAVHLRLGRFWTSKARGEVGVNLGVHTYPAPDPDGAVPLAFSVERNLGLDDPKTSRDVDALFNDTSKFARHMEIFRNVAMAHGDDLVGLVAAAKAEGFDAETGDTSASWSGGLRDDLPMSENAIRMQLNCEAETDFELALFFMVDPDVPRARVERAIFDHLNITHIDTTGAGLATIDGATYRVTLGVESAQFGNYYLLLSK